MDRGAWRATVRGVARVRHDLVTRQPQVREGEGTEVGRNTGGKTAHRTVDETDKIQVLGCPTLNSRFNSDLTSDLDSDADINPQG